MHLPARLLRAAALMFSSVLLSGCLASDKPLFGPNYQYAAELFPDNTGLIFDTHYGILKRKSGERAIYESEAYDDVMFLKQKGAQSGYDAEKEYVLAQFKRRSDGRYFYLYFVRYLRSAESENPEQRMTQYSLVDLPVAEIARDSGLSGPIENKGYFDVRSLGQLGMLPRSPYLGATKGAVYVLDLNTAEGESRYQDMVAAIDRCGKTECASEEDIETKTRTTDAGPNSAPTASNPTADQSASGNRAITKEEYDAISDFVDEQLKELNTALLMCKYYTCKETRDGRFIYQTKSKEYWFYPRGEVVDMSKIELK